MSSLFADTHNVVAILEKLDAAEGFEQIIDLLSGSYIHYALTVSPHIYISHVSSSFGTLFQLNAQVTSLGVVCLPNKEIFTGLAQIGVGKGFSEVETPLFEGMIAERQPTEEELGAEQVQVDVDVAAAVVEDDVEDVLDTCSALAHRVEGLENDKATQQLEIDEGIELVADQEKDVEVEGRHADKQAELYNLDQDHSSKVVAASTPIPTAKPKILNIAAAPAVSTRKRKGVVITNPEEELPSDTPAETPKVKEKGKGILIEAPKPMKKKDQIEMDAEYHGMKKKPQTKFEARKNMIFYLKNTEGYKMDFFKGMKYDEILPIFQAKFDANMRFLFKSREEVEEEDQEIIKSINETPVQKAAKRRKLSEEAQEVEDLRKKLEIVKDEDDDVFVEATPLAQKVPVVDYYIVVIDNKPRYKIIRADDTHQLYISFTTLLKNFNREDLDTLWRIVRDTFSTLKPTNFSDEYLLLTLKTMFEEPDGQDDIWRNQKSVHGLALVKRWKLLTSCGVHVITLSTVQLFLLVERRYPLLRFTLE
nr:hypothetical protein [Tanacetum cinerariifolium]